MDSGGKLRGVTGVRLKERGKEGEKLRQNKQKNRIKASENFTGTTKLPN